MSVTLGETRTRLGDILGDARCGPQRQIVAADLTHQHAPSLGAEISARASDVEAAVRRLTLSPESRSLEGLARFLLRSEAIASSWIEGMQVSAQQVALAELAQTEEPVAREFSHNAQLVANNITALRKAATELAKRSSVTVDGINELHHALLPDERHHGLRKVQNWIGGNDWNPVKAQFVPPPADTLRR